MKVVLLTPVSLHPLTTRPRQPRYMLQPTSLKSNLAQINGTSALRSTIEIKMHDPSHCWARAPLSNAANAAIIQTNSDAISETR